jgi:hypothetical protein
LIALISAWTSCPTFCSSVIWPSIFSIAASVLGDEIAEGLAAAGQLIGGAMPCCGVGVAVPAFANKSAHPAIAKVDLVSLINPHSLAFCERSHRIVRTGVVQNQARSVCSKNCLTKGIDWDFLSQSLNANQSEPA